eukprot:TRINITY_DN2920_c0_g1_i1.p1 TRINITY_DN2920_c0_g1~~TRINITY_DN2920_c0_g1_i1.p1  ORF type:complete len:657 (-),score=110.97 TRINITY_DN2920_c0_g1_i1:259-2229(-)
MKATGQAEALQREGRASKRSAVGKAIRQLFKGGVGDEPVGRLPLPHSEGGERPAFSPAPTSSGCTSAGSSYSSIAPGATGTARDSIATSGRDSIATSGRYSIATSARDSITTCSTMASLTRGEIEKENEKASPTEATPCDAEIRPPPEAESSESQKPLGQRLRKLLHWASADTPSNRSQNSNVLENSLAFSAVSNGLDASMVSSHRGSNPLDASMCSSRLGPTASFGSVATDDGNWHPSARAEQDPEYMRAVYSGFAVSPRESQVQQVAAAPPCVAGNGQIHVQHQAMPLIVQCPAPAPANSGPGTPEQRVSMPAPAPSLSSFALPPPMDPAQLFPQLQWVNQLCGHAVQAGSNAVNASPLLMPVADPQASTEAEHARLLEMASQMEAIAAHLRATVALQEKKATAAKQQQQQQQQQQPQRQTLSLASQIDSGSLPRTEQQQQQHQHQAPKAQPPVVSQQAEEVQRKDEVAAAEPRGPQNAQPQPQKRQPAQASVGQLVITSVPVETPPGKVKGKDNRTTIMLRNLPNDYTREMLTELLDEVGFRSRYDFVYLPVDFKRWAGLGYAFINMIDHQGATGIMEKLNGFSEWKKQSQKVCEVVWGEPLQGIDKHIQRYRNSPIMHAEVPDAAKPALFKDGVRIDFPGPTKKLRPPRVKR